MHELSRSFFGLRPGGRPRALAAVALLALAGCASVPPQALPAANAPAQWRAPLPNEAAWPHEGRLGQLVDWWRQQSDPVVASLVEAAQAASPTIASARARVSQAQAERVATASALLPQLDATGSAQRRSAIPPFPAGVQVQGALQMAWELDVFGGVRAQQQAAQWRLESADAAWHDARVSLAADVALQVVGWRHCHASLKVLQDDAQAASRTAALARRLADAGLQGAAQAGLAEAAAAESRNRARAQAQRCDSEIKALVALTALPEDTVRERLQSSADLLSWRATHLVPALPAATLAQRPDVFAAAASVAAAAADVGAQQAQRYPRVGLSGSIGRLSTRSDTFNADINTWSIGPLSVSVPVFDAGRRAAQVEAAQARHAQAVLQHQAVVRQAVREVEDALLALSTTAEQAQDAQQALDRARGAAQATRQLEQQGLASALEREDAVRRSMGAELAWLDLQRNRIAAWVSLYRAAGGGWAPTPVQTSSASANR